MNTNQNKACAVSEHFILEVETDRSKSKDSSDWFSKKLSEVIPNKSTNESYLERLRNTLLPK